MTSPRAKPSIPALYEADVSAEQPPAQAHARFPGADAHAFGTRRSFGAPTQRAQKTFRVNSGPAVRERFSRDDRLRKRREFEECYSSGVRVSGRYLQVFLLPKPQAPCSRLGVSVPKRVGHAATRNRVKRRIREIFRRSRPVLPPDPVHLVVNVRPSAGEAPFRELSEDYLSAVRRAASRGTRVG